MAKKMNGRWQTKITNLKQAVNHIYDTKEFSDIVFKIGQRRFKAHKLILGSQSSKFTELLLSPDAVDEIIVDEETVTPTGLEILFRFIYKGTLGTEDKTEILEAYQSAMYYQHKILIGKCEEEIQSWVITTKEVCHLLNVSRNCPELRDKCLNFIRDNADAVIRSPGFLKLNYCSLSTIIEKGLLSSVRVLQRLERVIEWAAKRHTEPIDYSLVRADLLDNNPPILGKLGIESLELQDLPSVITRYKNLLTPEEVLQFMMYGNDQNVENLPPWCRPA